MAIPDLYLQRIHRWCRERSPAELRDELRIEADVEARRHSGVPIMRG